MKFSQRRKQFVGVSSHGLKMGKQVKMVCMGHIFSLLAIN